MKYALSFISFVFSISAYAAGSGTGDQLIEAIQITAYDNLEIRLADQNHQSTCATSGQENKILVPANDNNFDHFLSLALAAHLSQRQVYIWIDNPNCVVQGATSYPRVSTLLIRDY